MIAGCASACCITHNADTLHGDKKVGEVYAKSLFKNYKIYDILSRSKSEKMSLHSSRGCIARTNYPTNLTDEQWERLKPFVERRRGTVGRPPKVDLREIINALLYMNRTGCQWRMFPSDFPPSGLIRYYFDKWNADGTWVCINDELRKQVRKSLGRDPEPSIGVIDSQSVKTTEAGGDRGFDAGKNVKGRKRQILVDTNGLLLRVLVYAANISDSEGAEWLLQDHHHTFPRMNRIRTDAGYKESLTEWMKANTKIALEVIEKPEDQVGFAVIPKRWVVERTFAWLGRSRRLSKEYEKSTERSESFIYLSSIQLMIKRLYPAK